MRIVISNIGPEGLGLEEEVVAAKLDLDTSDVKFRGPLHIKAFVSKAINLVSVKLEVASKIIVRCCRCLKEIEKVYNNNFELNLPTDSNTKVIDITQDLREEIILSYPLKPLCKEDCRGLCLNCGKDLNEAKCSCK